MEVAPPPIHYVFPEYSSSKTSGYSDGMEASASWKVRPWWSISPGYSLIQIHMHPDQGSLDTADYLQMNGSSPEHQAQLRSHLVLPDRFSFDWNTYFVDRLPALQIPAYTLSLIHI